jgi:hypothetical protein
VDPDTDLDLAAPSSKLGSPEAGVMHGVNAMPIERPCAFTRRPISVTSCSERPACAAAPAIFSTSTVTPTPRRPAVYSESSTATSSLVRIVSTSMPSALARSAAISKLSTSPV